MAFVYRINIQPSLNSELHIMTKARKCLISVDATPYYHCVSRCVRRAFLCGTDDHSGKSYEHRRGWLEDKLLKLPEVFAIDVAAYAIMNNHYHTVLHINSSKAKSWCDEEVVERWHQLFNGNVLSQRFIRGDNLTKVERNRLQISINEWRSRLQSISWFMRILNEAIAREANSEDDCTGRFWEGRFKSQALLDESALTACMVYVDLNPVRSKMAKTAETSDHTSIKRRYDNARTTKQPNRIDQQDKLLYPFSGNPKQGQPEGIQLKLTDYMTLVEQTGQIIRGDKRGSIQKTTNSIFARLKIDYDQWLEMTSHFEECFTTFAGAEHRVKLACDILNYRRPPNISTCKLLLNV